MVGGAGEGDEVVDEVGIFELIELAIGLIEVAKDAVENDAAIEFGTEGGTYGFAMHGDEVGFGEDFASVKAVDEVKVATDTEAGQVMAGEVGAVHGDAEAPADEHEEGGKGEGDAASMMYDVDEVAVFGAVVVGVGAAEAGGFEDEVGEGGGLGLVG